MMRTSRTRIVKGAVLAMAAQVANSNRGTFFFSMTVPKAVGMTGTFVAIDAIQ